MALNFNNLFSQTMEDLMGLPKDLGTIAQDYGYIPTPYGNMGDMFQNYQNFMNTLKTTMDRQLGAFNIGNNINALPLNMRNYMLGPSMMFRDPQWGYSGQFNGGWHPGGFSGNIAAYDIWKNQQNPIVNSPPPPAASANTGISGDPFSTTNTNIPTSVPGASITHSGPSPSAGGSGSTVNYSGHTYDLSTDAGRAQLTQDAANNVVPSGPGGRYISQLINGR